MLTMDKVMVLMMMFCSRSWLLLVWGLITLLLYGLVALAAGDRSTGAGGKQCSGRHKYLALVIIFTLWNQRTP